MEYLNGWTARDRGLAEALIRHEESLHTCGHPIDRSTHPDMDGQYAVAGERDSGTEPVYCHACAAAEVWRKQNKDPEPGRLIRVVDIGPKVLPAAVNRPPDAVHEQAPGTGDG
ncbi:hypothetical protein [Occultella kanbiaonis]|uniref:hypothetical protein n=1 Tax=Occultella kanbiaonis TaxID=2675754 RepID=UPI0013D4336B|nr:hypothetical protein [Occultella kanbiaonis]